MHYAVISTGGKQYLAQLGQSLIIESLPQAAGETVIFEDVLLLVDGQSVQIGQPKVSGTTVSATIVEQRLGDKLRVFKYRPKSRYSRTMGHRQHQTVVRIDAIGGKKAATESTVKADQPSQAAAKKAPRAKKSEVTKE
jgi:large subunit ribosomal protein L21